MRYTGAFSFTSLDQYDTCPQEFAYQRIQRLPREEGMPLIVGGAIHAVMQKYGQHCAEKGKPQDEAELAQILAAVRAGLSDAAGADVASIGERLGEVIFNPAVMREAEFELELAWDEKWQPVGWWDKTVFFRSKIDLAHLEGAMGVITDWKSNRQIPPQSEIDSSFQLEVYANAAADRHPEIPEWLIRNVYLRYGFATRERLIRREELAGTRAKIEAKAAAIRADEKCAPRIGPHCQHCDYSHRCPAFQKLYSEDHVARLDNPERAADAVHALIILRARGKDLEERLRAYVDVHGEIRVGDQQYGYRPMETIDFPRPQEVGNALASLGLPSEKVWEAMNATKTSVERALRGAGYKPKERRELLDQVVEKAGTRTTSTRLGFSKQEAEA